MYKSKLKLHDYFFPHKRNGYKPHIFRTTSLTIGVIGLLILQGAYFAQVNVLFPKTDFLAAVLPSALVSLTNTDRSARNLSSVTEDATLAQAAQLAADDMAMKGYFAHESPDGKTPWYWLNKVGYKYQYAGQNLAVNFTDSDEVENAWMNSPTHRANIVKGEYTKVGIGVANGIYEGKEVTFVVQFFATPSEGKTMELTVQEPMPIITGGKLVQVAAKERVLGVQSAPASSSAIQQASTSEARALVSAPVSTFVAKVVTAPNQTLIYILCALSVLVGVIVIIEVIMKAQIRYIEVTSGGLFLLVILLGLILFNVIGTPKVTIPVHASATSSDQ